VKNKLSGGKKVNTLNFVQTSKMNNKKKDDMKEQ